MVPTDSLERTLDAAAIPPERRGAARTARLNEGERSFYHWILRRFAGGQPPSPARFLEEAELRGLPIHDALATLAREDLMHLDHSGAVAVAVAVAYPFSGRPTAHRVRLDGHDLHAMCAIDALGIGPMLGTLVAIDSRDPLTGEVIHVEVNSDGEASWGPDEAVVVAGSCCDGAAYEGCCAVLNFFATPANAQRWLAEHSDARGHVVSIPEASAAGRAIFGAVLAERR